MDTTEKARVDDLVSAAARLALWLVDELEPLNRNVVEEDLDSLYELCVAVERRARAAFPDWQ